MNIVDNPREELARRAAEIAEQGLAVFPCDLNKAPMRGSHGFKDATDHPDKAYELFMKYPDARMIGVPMGTQTNLVCIDIDPKGMTAALGWLQRNFHRLGDTLIHRTPRGGSHFFYQHPKPPCPIIDCRQVVDGERLLGEGVDVKSAGGYVVFEGPGYTVVRDVPPAPMPIWMKNKIIRKPKPAKPQKFFKPQGITALEGALAKVAHTLEGNRNNLLFWAACRAGELVKQAVLSESEAYRACIDAGRQAGLPELDCRRTTRSGIETGKRS